MGHVAGGAGRGQGRKSNEAKRLAAIEKEKKDAEKKKRDLQKQEQDRLVAEQRKRELEVLRRRYLEEPRTVLAELGASAEDCAPGEEESNDDGALEHEICEHRVRSSILLSPSRYSANGEFTSKNENGNWTLVSWSTNSTHAAHAVGPHLFSLQCTQQSEALWSLRTILQQKDADLNFPDIEMNDINGNFNNEDDVAVDINTPHTPTVPPQIPLYVPPMQAAVQQSYVPAHNPLENIPTDQTRCAWYPKCKKTSIDL